MADEKILVTRSSIPEFQEYIDEIKPLWDSHWLTNMGSKYRKLTEELKEYLGVANLQLFVNGHMSIEMTLQAMELEGEVITTPFTFASTTHAIVRNGLKPVFCDISPDDYTMDADRIEELITDKTSAILPVHVYGNVCDIEKIDDIAKRYDLKVIYDAAHTFGESYKGRGIGSYGDASCFSFHATKVYNTIEGGAVSFNDDSLKDRLYGLIDFGIVDEETVSSIGANGKMNEFCAAMGLCNLRHVDEEIAKRGRAVERYFERLDGIDGLKLNKCKKDVKPNYAYFPVIFDKEVFGKSRDEVFEILKQEDIYARKYFYPLTSEFDCYRGVFDAYDTPVAQRISRQVLTLPIYADISSDDIDRICDIILAK